MTDTADHTEELEQLPDDAIPLCPGCLQEYDERHDFCPRCNCPVGLAVPYDPFRREWGLMWVYQRGAERPNRWYIVAG